MKNSNLFRLLIATCWFLLGFYSDANNRNLKGKLILTGSSTIAPLVNEIGRLFEKIHDEVRVDVQTGGSSRGIADTRRGTADIGMVSRSIQKDEFKDLKAFRIAQDGIGIIIHKKNSIKALSDEQVVKIYTGKIKNWKEVGGPNQLITVVNKAEGRSTLELFLKYFNLKRSDIRPSVIIGDNEQGIKTVLANEYSIGYVSIGAAEYSILHNIPIKLLSLNGIDASTKNIKNGTFPLSRSLSLVVKGEPKGLSKAFIKFSQSKRVYDLVKKQYFVPIVQ